MSLKGYELGDAKFSLTITDLERKFNINIADEAVLQQALRLVGVDAGDLSAVSASILDLIDPDDNPRAGGAESSYYQGLTPPYFAKNKPIDDLSELLLVRGVTPDIYWGGVATNHQRGMFQNQFGRAGVNAETVAYPVGLSDLFTPISGGRININTASAEVLQLIPSLDSLTAGAIVAGRKGGDDGSALLGHRLDPPLPAPLHREITNAVDRARAGPMSRPNRSEEPSRGHHERPPARRTRHRKPRRAR